MIYTFLKLVISAALIVGVSEVAKRSSFLGGKCCDLGVDLHLDAGDVRHGINRQVKR